MKSFEKILELLEEKKKQQLTEEEQKKVEFLDKLFKDKGCFFKLDYEVSLNILEFLGIEENEANAIYFDLISPEVYKATTPKIRHTTVKD